MAPLSGHRPRTLFHGVCLRHGRLGAGAPSQTDRNELWHLLPSGRDVSALRFTRWYDVTGCCCWRGTAVVVLLPRIDTVYEDLRCFNHSRHQNSFTSAARNSTFAHAQFSFQVSASPAPRSALGRLRDVIARTGLRYRLH